MIKKGGYMFNPIFFLSNRNGIPRLQTSAISVGTNSVTFTLPSNNAFYSTFNGLILLKMEQEIPTGTTDTFPIVLTSNAGPKTVTTLRGDDWTVADYEPGIHLAYYESNTGILQILI